MQNPTEQHLTEELARVILGFNHAPQPTDADCIDHARRVLRLIKADATVREAFEPLTVLQSWADVVCGTDEDIAAEYLYDAGHEMWGEDTFDVMDDDQYVEDLIDLVHGALAANPVRVGATA